MPYYEPKDNDHITTVLTCLNTTQLKITCSKLTLETLEEGVNF